MQRDYHVHSNYSDGSFLYLMLEAAEAAGLDAVGVADHCIVSERSALRRERDVLGFALDVTYGRRRAAIDDLREEFDLRVYDAVEMDYVRAEEDGIADFLADAEFDYAVGSVHSVDGVNVQADERFADLNADERRGIVDDYYDSLVALVDSGLFEIAAHPDLVERNEHLRGLTTEDHYERVAAAFADSRTVPEVNAGRALRAYGELHPAPRFFEVLREYGVEFTLGTDAHRPGDVAPRIERIEEFCAETGLEPVELAV
ncbi:histidinol-phosphatase [Halobacteriales archaeon QS_5_70_17]|nr:MAG: histidinol-phosphatase [Halobacteriales archaeon QS_5_70_17]